MTAPRSRKQTKQYDAYRKNLAASSCDFCQITAEHSQYVSETPHFYVIRNIFPYSFWDSQRVLDHLMILPKAHTDSLRGLSPAAATEFVQLMSDYESQGYNVYARTPGSVAKSIVHQHTHLIKTNGRASRFVFMMRRPYFRIIF